VLILLIKAAAVL